MAEGLAGLITALFALPFLSCGFGFIASCFWIFMIIHCTKNEKINGNDRVMWILIIIFLHFLGAFIYFFFGRKPENRKKVPGMKLLNKHQKFQSAEEKEKKYQAPQSMSAFEKDSDSRYYENYGK